MNKIKTYSTASIPEACDVSIHEDGRVVEHYYYDLHQPCPAEIAALEVGDLVRAEVSDGYREKDFPTNEVWEVISITRPGDITDPDDKTPRQRRETAAYADLAIAYIGNRPSRYDPWLVGQWRKKAGVVFSQRKIAGVKSRLAFVRHEVV